MDSILGNLPFCVCYVDDILIFSRTKEEHRRHVSAVLKRLQENGLVVVLTNAHSALKEWTFSVIACPRTLTPLDDVLKGKAKKLERGSPKKHTFSQTKDALANSTTLAYFDVNPPLRLTTDARNVTCGAVLEQHVDGSLIIGILQEKIETRRNKIQHLRQGAPRRLPRHSPLQAHPGGHTIHHRDGPSTTPHRPRGTGSPDGAICAQDNCNSPLADKSNYPLRHQHWPLTSLDSGFLQKKNIRHHQWTFTPLGTHHCSPPIFRSHPHRHRGTFAPFGICSLPAVNHRLLHEVVGSINDDEDTTQACAEALLSSWVSRFDVPDDITTERRRFPVRDMARSGRPDGNDTPQHNGIQNRSKWHGRTNLSRPQSVPDGELHRRGLENTTENVYGEALAVPGEFFPTSTDDTQLDHLRDIARKFRPCLKTYQVRTVHSKPRNLDDCWYVFLRVDAHQQLLTRPYRGPYRVIKKTTKAFLLDVHGQEDWV
ncbi:uncharacterized protein [Palaemon carinicauda]|uniref:uncharacterized protein n=1 Tax=Palaemon carinicauda TaxID=392227 RepID=UPI0035B5B6B4